MKLKHAIYLSTLGFAISLGHGATPVSAQAAPPLKIGVLADLSGLFVDLQGKGSVEAAKMAVQDFGPEVSGRKIELLSVDVGNKPDTSATWARKWYDEGVEMVLEGGSSSAALAIAAISTEKRKIYIASAPGTSALTNENCGPYVIHYTYDTYATATATVEGLAKLKGPSEWYFITADYAFGQSLERDATAAIKADGGKVLGGVKHPLGAADMSSFVLQAQQSKAPLVGLATAAVDMQNVIKTAAEYGVTPDKTLVALGTYISDIHALGLKVAQKMYLTSGWYWDQDERTREFGKRFFAVTGKMPTMVQAGVYSATTSYLQAVKKANSSNADDVMRELRAMKINDMFAQGGYIREDGRMVHDMLVVEVKSPSESKYPWDYYRILTTVPGDKAFQPLSASRCPLIKK